MSKNMKIWLGNSSQVISANLPQIVIGRDPATCQIVTEDISVSRQHARVYMDYGYLYLEDLGSSNGTWVNGVPVRKGAVPIDPSMQIFLGQLQLFLEDMSTGGQKTMLVDQPDVIRNYIAGRQAFTGGAAPQMSNHPSSGMQQTHAPFYANQGGQQPQYQDQYQQQYQQPQYQDQYQQQYQQPQYQDQYQQQYQQPAQPAQPVTLDEKLGVGGAKAPELADYKYRRQGSNSNGVLLIALPSDTFANDNVIDGFLEYTALDNETIASITIELVEYHKKGPKNGHVWDRQLVRQGPWKSRKGDILPMRFSLRVPTGTAASGRDVNWEIRGYVDINWAFDVQATSPIMMRNVDMEKVRDGLGTIDYRIVDLEPQSMGQRYTGLFQPPAQLRKELGVSNINLEIEYLGSDLLIQMEVEKTSLFKFDKKTEFKFDLARLREASDMDMGRHFMEHINRLMSK